MVERFYCSADSLVKIQCALLTLTGFGSAIYHSRSVFRCLSFVFVVFRVFTLLHDCSFLFFFSLFDGFPMLMLTTLLLLALADDVLVSAHRDTAFALVFTSFTSQIQKVFRSRCLRLTMSFCIHIVVLIYLVFALAQITIYDNQVDFTELFAYVLALFLLVSLCVLNVLRCVGFLFSACCSSCSGCSGLSSCLFAL